ncbi:MAG: hypothetical protein NW226_17440 [Microscillaceae bacterium]|nr:hypothetical protein [Microscillaceae bacterium]
MTIVNHITLEGVVVRVPNELNAPNTASATDNLKIILMTYGPQADTDTRIYQYFAIRFTKSLTDLVGSNPDLQEVLSGDNNAAIMKALLGKRLRIENGEMESGTIDFLNESGEIAFSKPVVIVYTSRFKITGEAYPPEMEELQYVFSNWANGSGNGYGINP